MKYLIHVVGFILAFVLLVFYCSLFTSCNVTKAKKTLSVDSTQTKKVDSGSVKKSTANEKTTADWERQILIYNKDTTINHYTFSGPQPAPGIDYSRLAAVINEKGNYQQEKQTVVYDSCWKREIDSLKLVLKEATKDKTEKAPVIPWLLVASILIGIVLLKICKLL